MATGDDKSALQKAKEAWHKGAQASASKTPGKPSADAPTGTPATDTPKPRKRGNKGGGGNSEPPKDAVIVQRLKNLKWQLFGTMFLSFFAVCGALYINSMNEKKDVRSHEKDMKVLELTEKGDSGSVGSNNSYEN